MTATMRMMTICSRFTSTGVTITTRRTIVTSSSATNFGHVLSSTKQQQPQQTIISARGTSISTKQKQQLRQLAAQLQTSANVQCTAEDLLSEAIKVYQRKEGLTQQTQEQQKSLDPFANPDAVVEALLANGSSTASTTKRRYKTLEDVVADMMKQQQQQQKQKSSSTEEGETR